MTTTSRPAAASRRRTGGRPAAASRRRTGGRPSLGERAVVPAAMWPELLDGVDTVRGRLARSEFLADLLSRRVGLPNLARYNKFCFDVPVELTQSAAHASRRDVTIRVPVAVAAAVTNAARNAGCPRSTYIAEEIALALGYSSTGPSRTEVLPLAM